MKTANSKTQLISLLNEHKREIKSFGVNRLDLFGSFQTGKITKTSDIDFLVEFSENKTSYDNYKDLAFYLEDILGRRIELITRRSLSKYIGPHILKQAENVLR